MNPIRDCFFIGVELAGYDTPAEFNSLFLNDYCPSPQGIIYDICSPYQLHILRKFINKNK